MAFSDAGNARHDLPGGAIAALESVPLDEGGLQGVKLVALRQTFDGCDLAPLDEGCERKA